MAPTGLIPIGVVYACRAAVARCLDLWKGSSPVHEARVRPGQALMALSRSRAVPSTPPVVRTLVESGVPVLPLAQYLTQVLQITAPALSSRPGVERLLGTLWRRACNVQAESALAVALAQKLSLLTPLPEVIAGHADRNGNLAEKIVQYLRRQGHTVVFQKLLVSSPVARPSSSGLTQTSTTSDPIQRGKRVMLVLPVYVPGMASQVAEVRSLIEASPAAGTFVGVACLIAYGSQSSVVDEFAIHSLTEVRSTVL